MIFTLIDLVIRALRILILIRIVLSWVAPYSRNEFTELVYHVTEPVLGPFRMLIPMGNMRMDLSPIIILTVSFLILTYISPNVSIRIIIISSLIFLTCCRICYTIWKHLPAVLPNRQIFLFITIAFLGGWHLLRIIQTIVFERQIVDFMQPSVIQGLAFLNINLPVTSILDLYRLGVFLIVFLGIIPSILSIGLTKLVFWKDYNKDIIINKR